MKITSYLIVFYSKKISILICMMVVKLTLKIPIRLKNPNFKRKIMIGEIGRETCRQM